MAAKTGLTVADLEKLAPPPESQGKAWELYEGEIVEVGNAVVRHERIKARIFGLIYAYLMGNRFGEVYSESSFRLFEDVLLIPDVAFLPKDRLTGVDPDKQFAVPPALAIEVISDSESGARMEQKVKLYLAAGVTEIWQVYPGLSEVLVITPENRKVYSGSDVLTTPVLPGFETPVDAFFEPLP
jgi:Uma2 family endonuclease